MSMTLQEAKHLLSNAMKVKRELEAENERLREQLGEIVRCRDCKHFEDGVCYRPDGDGDYARWIVEPVGFCAWGEKMEGGDE